MEQQQVDTALEQTLSVEDQNLFARVWCRVMPEQEHSPIAIGPAQCPQEEAAPAFCPQELSQQPTQDAPQSGALLPLRGAAQPDVPCLGEASLDYAPLLRERMDDTHGLWLAYQSLARRSQGHAGRQLSALAADQQRHLRQLGAVYFLLTGQRWAHSARACTPSGPVPSALREMFVREQQVRQSYLRSAEQVQDPCLEALFQELGAEAELHMDSIRHILERM